MKKILTVSAFAALLLAGEAEAGFFASNGPSVSSAPPRVLAAEDIPVSYDLRESGRVAPIRDQGVWSTCWAHAAIAALESSCLTEDLEADPETIDFSEMNLLWFARINQDKSRSFSMFIRNKAQLVHMGDYGTALQEGAYPTIALATLARLEGFSDEADFPYIYNSTLTAQGYSTNNPPTHSEAENVGLIPLRSSTPSSLVYTGRTVTPRSDLRMTDAFFAAANAAPAGFANQRRDYAELNKVSNDALKALIMRYGAAMISYYSEEDTGTNLNSSTYGYYISDPAKWKGNHEITIIGWDDNYSRDNFIDKPENDGAWLARNSWGSFWGSDGGYEWISYEQLIGDGVVCVAGERQENLHVYEHDPLGWCNSFVVQQAYIWAANVFKVESDGEVLDSVSFYTAGHNTQVKISLYDLGADFGGTDPTSGDLLFSAEQMMDYAGYHTMMTDRAGLTKGNYFSVIVQYTDTNEGGHAEIPVEVAIKRYSDNAAIYDKESFFSDDGTTWIDGTDMIDEGNGGTPYRINACIKVFTVAPNFSPAERAQASHTINGIPVETFTPAQTVRINSRIPSSTSRRAVIALDGGANADVSVYLVDKSRTYEPVNISDDEKLDEEGYPKGRTGPVEWVDVPVYKTGYKPDFFWNDAGIDYPVYGPFSHITNESGDITVNVDALEYPDGSRAKIPQSYYTFYCEPSSGSTTEVGVALLAESSAQENNNNGGGGSGGCSAGISAGLFMLALSAYILRRK
ncbi:MAG: hypothetical protein IJT02_03785 [Synergistaceae bacterium]|nr:hypothetical protein [Synergistaceae bacterium]